MLEYLHTKARPFVVFLFSLVFIGFFILFSLFSTNICPHWEGMLIGIIMMILAIPFHWHGKKRKWCYLVSFIINAIAAGFVVSEYYIEYETMLTILEVLAGAIPAAGILLLTYLMLQIYSKSKKVTLIVACLLNAAVSICAVILWIVYGNVIFSFGFFSSLISFFYLCVFGITVNHEERSVLRDISFGSFGSFIIIAVVVIFILSEGDILDGLDFGGDGDIGRKKKKEKVKKP